MGDWNKLKEQTMAGRRALVALLESDAHRADVIPPTWNNNLHWHAGHLATTPHMLTFRMLGEPIGVPEDYRRWFAKGTSPAAWPGEPIPSFEILLTELLDGIPKVFDAFEDRAGEPFAKPYLTSVGIELRTPADALTFSMIHDGIHIGMITALKRGLQAMG